MGKQVLCACTFCRSVSNNVGKYVSISTYTRHRRQEKELQDTSTSTSLINVKNLSLDNNNRQNQNELEIKIRNFISLPSILINTFSEVSNLSKSALEYNHQDSELEKPGSGLKKKY
ncbi:hypothetical protein C2G38_2083818 [Gigaspora rosea]|uniref:Uncharacterized protein n=1 Tax=Gigaspora rosea TaxID=44941 RepID=A0A397VB31_9GLOM|nr:hypothetical protein C2G38_2083818 [Gigaspora rosea]